MASFVILLIARTARIACSDRHTDTHTHTRDNYCNPLCACAPRVNNTLQISSYCRYTLKHFKHCYHYLYTTVFVSEHGSVVGPVRVVTECSQWVVDSLVYLMMKNFILLYVFSVLHPYFLFNISVNNFIFYFFKFIFNTL